MFLFFFSVAQHCFTMSLKYLAAFALLSLSKAKPSKDEVAAVVKASGAAVDAAELDYVFTQLNGKDVNTLIAEGQAKMTAAAPAGGAAAPAAAAAAAPAAGKKEDKKKVEEEEEDGDMGFGLFD
jgi:large subunit ribosomal protein LP2